MLEEFDRLLTLKINSFHNEFFDAIMIFASEKYVWFPFYAIIIVFLTYKEKKRVWLVLLAIVLLITMADQIASGLLKPLVQRLRPCHDFQMQSLLHLPIGCGGTYGFVSSHAANTWALAVFFALFFNNKKFTIALFIWAFVICYSRVYLGAHFVGDVVVGGSIGAFLGWILFRTHQVFYAKIFNRNIT